MDVVEEENINDETGSIDKSRKIEKKDIKEKMIVQEYVEERKEGLLRNDSDDEGAKGKDK